MLLLLLLGLRDQSTVLLHPRLSSILMMVNIE
jgi:hypothetical protein